jgi:hypothetical protein
MLDLTGASISEAYVHRIGNKARNEDLFISSSPLELNPSLESALFKLFFSAFYNADNHFQFHHEENIELNEAYSYVNSFFESELSLQYTSSKLAKLLYRITNHPNIHSGELIVAKINNVILSNTPFNILGVFKSEEKDNLIEINQTKSSLNAQLVTGINPRNLDKGALIFPSKGDFKIQIFNKKNSDSIYWNNSFLGCRPFQSNNLKTKHCLNACLQFQTKLAKKSKNKASLMSTNNALFEYFNNATEFSADLYVKEIGLDHTQTTEFKEHIKQYEKTNNISLSKKFKFDGEVTKSIKKRLTNILRLDDSIEIKVSLESENPAEIIEKGFDQDRKMSFYKIYFSAEN